MGYSKGATKSSLHSAVDYGDLELVKCLTSHKEVDPFSRDLLNGNMALHLAATTDDKHEIVEFFVSTYGPRITKNQKQLWPNTYSCGISTQKCC